jgi:hypothetical protein
MAIEAMLGHWDGYCQNQNNFRLWFGTAPARAMFLPHGMDQLYGDVDASVLDHPTAIVAHAVARHPEWRKLYRKRLEKLLPLFSPRKLRSGLTKRAAPLLDELKQRDRALAADYERAVDGLIDRVEKRYRFLQRDVHAPEPQPLAFRGDTPHKLKKWNAAGETDGIALRRRSYQGTTALHFAIGERSAEARRGAFRAPVLLAKGRYRLSASARCADVEVGVEAEVGGGARLRVGDAVSEALVGDQRWTELVCEFTVAEFRRAVELRLELRALAGKAWFRLDSLRLQRLGDD